MLILSLPRLTVFVLTKVHSYRRFCPCNQSNHPECSNQIKLWFSFSRFRPANTLPPNQKAVPGSPPCNFANLANLAGPNAHVHSTD
ncbi:hypothetical protein F4778DRAFT_738814 [Xylariomycetidae sp. FL2044]|nr:hypothetical protein F4778DRAFT_738814 [Xylariomycetidae sp. FL2044]